MGIVGDTPFSAGAAYSVASACSLGEHVVAAVASCKILAPSFVERDARVPPLDSAVAAASASVVPFALSAFWSDVSSSPWVEGNRSLVAFWGPLDHSWGALACVA